MLPSNFDLFFSWKTVENITPPITPEHSFVAKLTCFYNTNLEVKTDANHFKKGNITFTHTNKVHKLMRL